MSSRSFDLLVKPDPYGPSRTKNVPKAEHDINMIVDRYRKTGQIPVGTLRTGQFADVSNVGDLMKVHQMAKQFVELTEKALSVKKVRDEEAKKSAAAAAAKPPGSGTPPAPPSGEVPSK